MQRALVPLGLSRLVRRLDGKRCVVGERDEHLEVAVGGPPAAQRLVDRDDPEQDAPLVAHRDEEPVLGIPRVGMTRTPSSRSVGVSERVPVDGTGRHEVGAAPLEPLREQNGPGVAGLGVAEQRRPRVLVSVHRRNLEVVPLGLVEVHRDGAVAERFADGPGNGFEQRGEILTRPQ